MRGRNSGKGDRTPGRAGPAGQRRLPSHRPRRPFAVEPFDHDRRGTLRQADPTRRAQRGLRLPRGAIGRGERVRVLDDPQVLADRVGPSTRPWGQALDCHALPVPPGTATPRTPRPRVSDADASRFTRNPGPVTCLNGDRVALEQQRLGALGPAPRPRDPDRPAGRHRHGVVGFPAVVSDETPLIDRRHGVSGVGHGRRRGRRRLQRWRVNRP